jgi:co-chaperonin GroES (HSP10)
MRAVNRYIIIEKLKEEPKPNKGGLILAEQHQNDIRYQKAKVISIGNLIEGLNKDEMIYYDKHAGYGIEFEDKLFYVIKEQDVIAVL